MAAKNSTISIKYDGNQLPIFPFSPGEGKKSVDKVLNCINLWDIYIHPISMSISKSLILEKNYGINAKYIQ